MHKQRLAGHAWPRQGLVPPPMAQTIPRDCSWTRSFPCVQAAAERGWWAQTLGTHWFQNGAWGDALWTGSQSDEARSDAQGLIAVCQPSALPQLPRSGLMLSWDLLSVAGQLKLHGAASSLTFLCCYCLAKAEALFWSKKNLKSLDGFFSCWGRWECWDRQ